MRGVNKELNIFSVLVVGGGCFFISLRMEREDSGARIIAEPLARLFRVEVDGDNEAVETQYLSEDKDEDHADEEAGLLRRTTDARVSYYADREACRQS